MKPRKATHDWWNPAPKSTPIQVGDYVMCVDSLGKSLAFLRANRYRLALVVGKDDDGRLGIRFVRSPRGPWGERTYGMEVATHEVTKAYGCFQHPIETIIDECVAEFAGLQIMQPGPLFRKTSNEH